MARRKGGYRHIHWKCWCRHCEYVQGRVARMLLIDTLIMSCTVIIACFVIALAIATVL